MVCLQCSARLYLAWALVDCSWYVLVAMIGLRFDTYALTSNSGILRGLVLADCQAYVEPCMQVTYAGAGSALMPPPPGEACL